MAKRLQHRGGTTSQHSTFTGAVREVTVDTDKNTLVVHDGATAGGHPLATATNFTSTGIDDNATSTAITIDSGGDVVIGSGGLDTSGIGGTFTALNMRAGAGYPVIYGQTTATTTNKTALSLVGATSGASAGGAAELLAGMEISCESDSSTNATGFIRWYTGSGGSLSERMRITSSGNVGIGTSSPVGKLDVVGSVYCDDLQVDGDVVIQKATGDVSLTIAANENASNREPSLNLKGYNTSSNPIINFGDNNGYPGAIEYENADNSMRLYTGTSERVRIDSSGNVLIGKTTTGNTVAGVVILPSGRIDPTRDGATSALFNRLTSAGNIVEFKQDGTTVGSIGSRSGSSNIYIESLDSGRLRANGVDVAGWNSSNGSLFSASDNGNDLGTTGNRWKDIYIGGGLYVGGTAAANKLDDYEVGDWTPVLGAYAGTPTINNSHYIKIGKLVMASTRILLDGTSDASNFQIAGLPFTCKNTTNDVFGAIIGMTTSTVTRINILVNRNNTDAYLYNNDGSIMSYNTFGNDKQIRLSIIYQTD